MALPFSILTANTFLFSTSFPRFEGRKRELVNFLRTKPAHFIFLQEVHQNFIPELRGALRDIYYFASASENDWPLDTTGAGWPDLYEGPLGSGLVILVDRSLDIRWARISRENYLWKPPTAVELMVTRGFLRLDLNWAGREWSLINTHTTAYHSAFLWWWRERQLEQVAESVRELGSDRLVIMGGDLNMRPLETEWKGWTARGWLDLELMAAGILSEKQAQASPEVFQHTWSDKNSLYDESETPAKLDYLFWWGQNRRPIPRVKEYTVLPERWSDHYPARALLELES